MSTADTTPNLDASNNPIQAANTDGDNWGCRRRAVTAARCLSPGRSRGRQELPDEVEAVIRGILGREYLTQQKETIGVVHRNCPADPRPVDRLLSYPGQLRPCLGPHDRNVSGQTTCPPMPTHRVESFRVDELLQSECGAGVTIFHVHTSSGRPWIVAGACQSVKAAANTRGTRQKILRNSWGSIGTGPHMRACR